jgi:uncharacterized protein involved in exopolysaccharide biosynthesis
MEKRGLLMLLFKSKYLILLSILSVVSAAVLASVLLPPVYEATATILVTLGREHLPNAPLQDQAYLKSPNPTEIIDREVAILRSEDMLEKVVGDVGIEKLYPALLQNNKSKQSPRRDAVDTLKKKLIIPTKSNVLSISFRHSDPQVAADVINGLVKSYQERRLEVLARPPLDYARQHLEGTEMQLREAEEALQAFQQKHHLFAMQDQLRLLLTQRAEFDARQHRAEEMAKELRSRHDSLDQDLRRVAGDKARYTQLDKIITETQAKVISLQIEQALLADYGPSHPKAISVRSQLDAAQRELEAQQRLVNGRKPTADPVYQHLEKEMLTAQADLEGEVASAGVLGEQSKALDRRIEDLGSLQTELLRLQREQGAREGTYRVALKNYDEMRANADMNEKRIGGVSVIQNAIVPTKPTRPGLFSSIVGGLVGGAALGVGLTLLSQWLSQKLWHPQQVRERLELPLLGTVGFFAPSARNDGMLPMLMPPGSEGERKLLGPSQPTT